MLKISDLQEQFLKVIDLINYTNEVKHVLRKVWKGYRKAKAKNIELRLENKELRLENKLYKELIDFKCKEVEQLKAEMK